MRSILMLFLLGVGSAASDASEPAASRPYWTGRIEQDTAWRDTVYVGGDVTIAAVAALTLAPNTQVLFLPYHDATRGGLDSTRAELIVEGRLAAQAGGIVFRSAESAGQETTSTTAVKKQGSSFLRGSLRVAKKVASGTIVGTVFSGIVLGGSRSAGGDSGIGAAAAGYAAFGLGYPIGVYAVDARESSFWLTLIGGGLGWWGAATLSERAAWVTFFGAPVLASELSRKDAVTGGPKQPKQSQDLRFSLGLVPEFQGGLSAVATLRF